MTGARRTGATAAAVLPAALAGALLVSAPFAGTTTAPLATSKPQALDTPTAAAQPHPHPGLSAGSLATLAGSEVLLLGVGTGVLVYARRRRAGEA